VRRSIPTFAVVVLVLSMLPLMAVADGHGACGEEFTPIYEIQGDGDESPLVGQTIVTEGIVTVDLQRDEEHDGFFIQDRHGDRNTATSDGIWVRHKDSWGFDVEVGDRVRIEAKVSEYRGETQLGNVFVDAATVCGSGHVPPTRVKTRGTGSSEKSRTLRRPSISS